MKKIWKSDMNITFLRTLGFSFFVWMIVHFASYIICYIAVLWVVTQRSQTTSYMRHWKTPTSFPGFSPTRPYGARERRRVGERTWERDCGRHVSYAIQSPREVNHSRGWISLKTLRLALCALPPISYNNNFRDRILEMKSCTYRLVSHVLLRRR